MKHIVKVTTNLKGESKPINIGQRTLLIGPNGSGKSRIWQAIEFALTARVGDIAGRDEVSRPADLLALMPGREGTLTSSVVFDDGDVAACKIRSKAAGSATRPIHTHSPTFDKARVLPLRRLKDATLGAPDKARQFFLAEAVGATTHKDVLALIPKPFHRDYAKVAGYTIFADLLNDEREPAALLVTVKDTAHQRVLKAKRELKADEAILSQSGAHGGVYPTDEAVMQLEAALLAASEAYRTAQNVAIIRASAIAHNSALGDVSARLALLRAQFTAATEKQTAAHGALGVAQKALSVLPPENVERRARAVAVHVLLQRVLATGIDDCGLCGTTAVGGLQARAQYLTPKLEAIVNDNQRARLTQLVAQFQFKIRTAAQELASIRQRYETASNHDLMDVPDATDPEPFNAEHARLTKEHAELHASRRIWKSVQDARNRVSRGKEHRDYWARVEDACSSAIGDLLTTAIANFSARVNRFLPEGDSFGLVLHEGAREVVQFGLWRQGPMDARVLHTALSGAEWARVTAALACALTRDGEFAIVCPEERAYDPKTLRAVMVALSDTPCQVILCSPVTFRGRKPKGWDVIEVEDLKLEKEEEEEEEDDLPPEPAATRIKFTGSQPVDLLA